MMRKNWMAWGGVFLLCVGMINSAAAVEVVKKIDLIGLNRVKRGRVLRLMRQRVGKPFSQYLARQDFLKIYKSNLFANVELRADTDEKGVKLTYVLQERPLVQDIEFSGNKKIKDAKITSFLKEKLESSKRIRKGKTLASYQLKVYTRLIKEFYEKEGYYLANVEAELKETDVGFAVVKFNIKENKPIRIKWIEFFGNKAIGDWRLRRVLETKKYSFPFILGRFEEEKFKEDIKQLTEYYHKRGYLSMRVADHKVNVNKKRNRIYLEITVDEGPRYRYGKTEVVGNKLFSTKKILYWTNLKARRKYKQKKVDEAISVIKDQYGEKGYIFAYVNITPILNRETGQADLKVVIDEGRKNYVERIDFKGNEITKEKVLRREMLIEPTEVANTKLVRRSYEKLQRLGYFKELEPRLDQGSSNDLINIVWQMQEQKTGRFTIGAAYSNRDKVTGQMGLGIINLMGYGQKMSVDLEIGEKLFYYRFSFTEPYLFDTHYYFNMQYDNTRREVVGYENYADQDSKRVGYFYHKQGGSVTIGHPFYYYLWVYVKHGVIYGEYRKLNNIDLPNNVKEEDLMTRTLGLTVKWDNRDDTFFPVRGNYQELGATQAGGFLKGDNNFTKLKFDSRWYYGFYRERLALAARFTGDFVKEFGASESVPVEDKFGLGGTNSVRGYPDFGLGFQQRYRLFGNTEFRWRPHKMFQLVAFWDVGGIWDNQIDMKTADFYPGSGLGFRMNVPMLGTVRIDYGVPLDPRWPQSGQNGLIHFNVGTTF